MATVVSRNRSKGKPQGLRKEALEAEMALGSNVPAEALLSKAAKADVWLGGALPLLASLFWEVNCANTFPKLFPLDWESLNVTGFWLFDWPVGSAGVESSEFKSALMLFTKSPFLKLANFGFGNYRWGWNC